MSKKAVVVLAEGFEELEAGAPVDVLRRAGVAVTVAGLGGMDVKSAHDMVFVADALVDGLSDDFDLIVLPGGMPGSKNLGESPVVKALTEKMLAGGKLVSAICAAPIFTLGAWGMLDNRKATCYAGMEGMFPKTVTFSPETVVVDGKITTSRGPATAIPFALSLAAQLQGQAKADEVAAAMLVK